MRYTVYSTDGATAIITAEAEAIEIGCNNCGANWVRDGLPTALFPCPYCDDFYKCGIAFTESTIAFIAAEQSRGGASYGRDLRGIARQFWGGAIDYDQAFFYFDQTIRLGLTHAWHAGARECGIQPSELSPEELSELQAAIFNETSRLGGLLQFIEENSKAKGGAWATAEARVALWALRYDDVMGRARLMACADQKGVWVRGPTSDSCATCLSMDQKCKRFSYWATHGPHPKAPPNPTIQCQGFRCLCEIVPTDAPLSRGPLPRWP